MFKNILIVALSVYTFLTSHMIHSQPSISSSHQMSLMNRLLDTRGVEYDSLEHQAIGDSILIKYFIDEPGERGQKLNLSNGLELSYGQIIMLAGDFFAIAKTPISLCGEKKQQVCFEKAFASLAINGNLKDTQCQSPTVQAKGFLAFYDDVLVQLTLARENNIPDWQFYYQHSGEFNKKLNQISCGGSFISPYIPFGNYLKLSQNNIDHFIPHALEAYRVGHTAALNDALKAHHVFFTKNDKTKAKQLLTQAYAKNAFASHYLTDALSSGHMRVPRKKIHDTVLMPAILKLLLSNFMHDEDNRQGLDVTNGKGFSWRAYGDGYLNKPKADIHRYMIHQIIQTSADAIYDVFVTGIFPNKFAEFDYLPDYSKINTLNSNAPLFKVIDGQVYIRKAINNRQLHQWSKMWSGLISLIDLELNFDIYS
jgi:hypothetical protein